METCGPETMPLAIWVLWKAQFWMNTKLPVTRAPVLLEFSYLLAVVDELGRSGLIRGLPGFLLATVYPCRGLHRCGFEAGTKRTKYYRLR
jgi:hypothetical protein